MTIYFAGAESFRTLLEEIPEVKNVLLSYYYMREDISKYKKYNIFIDSGGFSARKNNVEINIKNYRDFLDMNKEYITVAANLDISNFEQSWKNQKFLEETFPVIPVYHYQEYFENKWDLLNEICQKYKYIALGGTAGNYLTKQVLRNYLNFCFKTILKYKTKVHGFGITNPILLKIYPFYSVDSTTWSNGGRYGTIGQWKDFKYSRIHYSEKDKILRRNLDVKALTDYKKRLLINIKQQLEIEKSITNLWKSRGIVWN